ncbi:MAG: helix-turn-helix transcriptional regulator [Candidatus Firestonebacteria bacterium]
MEIVKDLKTYCLENKITQEILAKKLKVAFATVNRWFNGKTKPNETQAYHIKKLLNEKIINKDSLNIRTMQVREKAINYGENKYLKSGRCVKSPENKSYYRVDKRIIETIKIIRDVETKTEYIVIRYVGKSGKNECLREAVISGEDLAELMEKYLKDTEEKTSE